MEEKESLHHTLALDDQRGGTLTGVLDVMSFNENEIFLKTGRGNLVLKGKNLHICRLQLESGEVEIEGRVDSMNYTPGTVQKRASLMQRLFR